MAPGIKALMLNYLAVTGEAKLNVMAAGIGIGAQLSHMPLRYAISNLGMASKVASLGKSWGRACTRPQMVRLEVDCVPPPLSAPAVAGAHHQMLTCARRPNVSQCCTHTARPKWTHLWRIASTPTHQILRAFTMAHSTWP